WATKTDEELIRQVVVKLPPLAPATTTWCCQAPPESARRETTICSPPLAPGEPPRARGQGEARRRPRHFPARARGEQQAPERRVGGGGAVDEQRRVHRTADQDAIDGDRAGGDHLRMPAEPPIGGAQHIGVSGVPPERANREEPVEGIGEGELDAIARARRGDLPPAPAAVGGQPPTAGRVAEEPRP